MTRIVRLAGRLPNHPRNGLDAIHRALVAQLDGPADQGVVAIVRIGTKAVERDADSRESFPLLRLLHIEPIKDEADEQIALDLLTKAYRARTNEMPELPYDDQGAASGAILKGAPPLYGDPAE